VVENEGACAENYGVKQDMTAIWASESEIALLRQDLNQYRAANKSDIALFLASMTIRFGLMLVVAVGALFTAPTLMLRWVIR